MLIEGKPSIGKVAVVGTCSFDQVICIDHFPHEDYKYMCELDSGRCGGIPLNVGVNLAILGIPVNSISFLGTDSTSLIIRDHANQLGISTDGLESEMNATPRVFILASKDTGTRTAFMTIHDSPSSLTVAQRRMITDSAIVHYGCTLPEIDMSMFELCRQSGTLICVNYELPSSHAFEAFQLSDFGVISEQILSNGKMNSWEQLESQLRSLWRPNHKYIGVTLGNRGSLFYDGIKIYKTPSATVKERDTTGAGDAFQAGLIFGLLKDWDLEHSIKFATCLGALKCTHIGSNLASLQGLNIEKEALKIFGRTIREPQ